MAKRSKKLPTPNPGRASVAVLLRLPPDLVAWIDLVAAKHGGTRAGTVEAVLEALRHNYSEEDSFWQQYASMLLQSLGRVGAVPVAAFSTLRDDLEEMMREAVASRKNRDRKGGNDA